MQRTPETLSMSFSRLHAMPRQNDVTRTRMDPAAKEDRRRLQRQKRKKKNENTISAPVPPHKYDPI